MTEYIIDWGGIGARLVELYEEGVPLFLWTKRLREERLREKVVRCRDCVYFTTDGLGDYCTLFDFEDVKGIKDRYCAWGERRRDA